MPDPSPRFDPPRTTSGSTGFAPVPLNESARVEALAAYEVLDTPPDLHFDDISKLAATLCGTKIAGVGFLDRERYWLKSVHGLGATQMARDLAVCAYVVAAGTTLAVEDAAVDPRFKDKPFVTAFALRSYLGTPLLTAAGHAVGVLWVADPSPLNATETMRCGIEALARQVMELLEHRIRSRALAASLAERDAQRARLLIQPAVLSLIADGAPLRRSLGALARLTEDQLTGQRCAIVPGATTARRGSDRFVLPLEDHRTGRVLATLILSGQDDPMPTQSQWEVVRHAADLARIAVLSDDHDAELSARAHCDDLTKLPNRRALEAHLDEAVRRCRAGGPAVGVLFCDLDRFKSINDTLGHSAGDAYLVAFANRLRMLLRTDDFVARFGGDEFVVVGGDTADEPALDLIASRIHAALAEPITIAGREVTLSASIGITVLDASADPEVLLRDADAAMYRAKDAGGAQVARAEQSAHVLALDRLELTEDLRRALAGDGLAVHYQPVIDLRTGDISGAEALVRWNHPVRGFLSPAQFLPLAEEAGLARALDEYVLAVACRQIATWQVDPDMPPVRLFVNLSAKSLGSPGLARMVTRILSKTGAIPHLLGLEVTEASLALAEEQVAVASLSKLRVLGVTVALDDFGTGASSLARLRDFPLDVVKLDRAFIGPLAECDADASFVSAVVALAGAVGLRVVAEGIETPQQAATLLSIGCPSGQGYLFAPAEAPAVFYERVTTAHAELQTSCSNVQAVLQNGFIPSEQMRCLMPATTQ